MPASSRLWEKFFGPKKPHLVKTRGLSGELNDLRKDLLDYFKNLEGVNNPYAKQANWYWHPTNGNDNNDGKTNTRPVKTFAEIVRRIGTAPLQQVTDIWLMGDTTEILQAPHPIRVAEGAGSTAYMLRIRGDLGITTVLSSTFTATTAFSAATNTPTDVTDATVNWNTVFQGGSALGHRLRRTSDSAVGWIQKIISNTQARTTCWSTIDPFATNPSINPTLVTDPGNNAYVLERLPKIGGCNLEVVRHGRQSSSNLTGLVIDSVWYSDLAAEGSTAPGFIMLGSVVAFPYASRCKFGTGTIASVRVGTKFFGYFVNCHTHGTSIGLAGFAGFLIGGGTISATVSSTVPEAAWQINRHFMVQGGTFFIGKGIVTADGLCIFDSTAAGLSIQQGGAGTLHVAGSSVLWGNGNATFGADVPAGTKIIIGTGTPVLTGTTANVRVGGDAGDTWANKIAAGIVATKGAGVVQ